MQDVVADDVAELAYLDQFSIHVASPFCRCSDSMRILVEGTGAIGQNSTTRWAWQ